ncbi:MAG: DUF805 domain-containing protein [Lachnospiraceae bacterium]|nr:DUF805 domain-containing protein [Lachnospiraceae bacterium]
MEIVNNYVSVLKNYVAFSGRARRREYWLYVLANFIVSLVISVIAGILHLPILSTIYALGVMLPGIAVCVRRLHDTGKSGLWLLLAFVPLIGGIVLLVFFCSDSEVGTNDFGPNPKEFA